MRVTSAVERRPGDGVFVKIDARRDLVHFVGPVAGFDSRLACRGGKDSRHSRTMCKQMGKKPVFLDESLAIAHRAVMAFDEDAAALHGDDASSGKRARACGKDVRGFAEIGKLGEKRAQLIERERRPVGLDQRAVHAVGFDC